ncbi:MAG: hypothetical protein WCA82_00225, partial [Jiangellales bacterium]
NDQWRAAGAAAWMAMRDHLAEKEWPTEPGVVADVVAALPRGATALLGASQPIRDVHLVAAPRPDLRLLANRGLAGIDGTISTGVGVALASESPTYAVMGDLTFWHDATGLLVGPSEPRPDLCLVVVDNDRRHLRAARAGRCGARTRARAGVRHPDRRRHRRLVRRGGRRAPPRHHP